MVVGMVALYLGADDCMKDFADHVKSYNELHFIVRALIALAIGVLITLPTVLFLRKLSSKTMSDLFVFAVVAFLACAFAQLSVHFIKPLVGRARYRAIWLLGDESLYTPWYVFNGERISKNALLVAIGAGKDAFRSFPSGHTASAGAVYVLLALPYCLKKFDNNKSKIILTCISVIVTGMVAVSRIIVGAHYFSDVLIGGTFSFIWVYITLVIVKFIIGKIEKKTNKPFVDEIGNINLSIFNSKEEQKIKTEEVIVEDNVND
jgi:membrane-associated phospholipid phosphatase